MNNTEHTAAVQIGMSCEEFKAGKIWTGKT